MERLLQQVQLQPMVRQLWEVIQMQSLALTKVQQPLQLLHQLPQLLQLLQLLQGDPLLQQSTQLVCLPAAVESQLIMEVHSVQQV